MASNNRRLAHLAPQSVGVLGGEEAADKAEYRVGSNALSVRVDGQRVEPAISDGVITNWSAAESILEHTLHQCLSTNPADHPLLMAEAGHTPQPAREKLTELAFEKLGVPAFFLSKNPVLTAFASGRGTALVLDVGGGTTSASAVHDGYTLSRSIRRHGLAGDLISELVLKSSQLRSPPPPLQPLYTLKRKQVGPGEYTSEYIDYPVSRARTRLGPQAGRPPFSIAPLQAVSPPTSVPAATPPVRLRRPGH